MKFRIFGTLVVFAILCAVYIVQENNKQPQQPVPTGDTQPADPDVNALKGLKIN